MVTTHYHSFLISPAMGDMFILSIRLVIDACCTWLFADGTFIVKVAPRLHQTILFSNYNPAFLLTSKFCIMERGMVQKLLWIVTKICCSGPTAYC